MKIKYLILLLIFSIQLYALSLNLESRISNIGDRVTNLDPESRATTVVDNHPGAVTAACAVWAKGACIAYKAVKYGSSEAMSTTNKPVHESKPDELNK